MKLGQDVCLAKILDDFEIGSCGVITRLLGQTLEIPCVRSRGHIVGSILMKLTRNVCLDEILDEFENRSCGVKN